MLRYRQILVSTLVLGLGVATLSACGQQGPLYLPTESGAAKRPPPPEGAASGSPNATPAPTAP